MKKKDVLFMFYVLCLIIHVGFLSVSPFILTLFFPIFLIQNFSAPAIPKRNLQIHTAIKSKVQKL